ncbi:MAG: hypothetical protein AAF988_04715 [Pseudomonadota bacterium]
MNIDIDSGTAEKLKTVAAMQETTVEELLRAYADEQEKYLRELKEDMNTLESMKQGDFISQDDMFKKMDTLREQAKALASNMD